MRILYIVPFVPWQVRVRSYNLLPRLAQRHDIFLLCLGNSAEEEARLEVLRPYCRRIQRVHHNPWRAILQCALALPTRLPLRTAYFFQPKMREAVRRALAEFSPDLIYVERWRALQYVPAGVQVPVLCDPTDSMLLYNLRLMWTGSWWEKLVAIEEAVKFMRYEPRLSTRPSVTVFCSCVDLECVRRRAPESRFAIVPNGVDCQKFFFKEESDEEPAQIIFTGSFTHSPNRHAVELFLERIFPIVKRRVPACRFVVVGNQARRHLRNSIGKGTDVEILTFAQELRPALAKATVAVAPLNLGVGVTNKVLEAFATGTAVVATRLACGDLPVRGGEHLLLADDPTAFAEQVVRLLLEPDLRRYLALNARRLVEETYDWEIISGRMERLMQEVARSRARTSLPVDSIA